MTAAIDPMMNPRFAWRHLGAALLVVCLFLLQKLAYAAATIVPVPTQYIAALGDQTATQGTGAESWGLWRLDPGPRGVRLGNFSSLKLTGGIAPSLWHFDDSDWWLEEHGLIMEAPTFPVPPGRYIVTGDREMVAMLTIHPKDSSGAQRWELDKGASIYDVTHLRCRAARYTPETSGQACTPGNVAESNFPVVPGAAMPPVPRCNKLDYQVLIVIGMAVGE